MGLPFSPTSPCLGIWDSVHPEDILVPADLSGGGRCVLRSCLLNCSAGNRVGVLQFMDSSLSPVLCSFVRLPLKTALCCGVVPETFITSISQVWKSRS